MSHASELPIASASNGAERIPPFENPDNFRQSPGEEEGLWYCVACKQSPYTGPHLFDATMAIKHEKSEAHKTALKKADYWGASLVDGWGYDWGQNNTVYENLAFDQERERVPAPKRVKYWIKEVARAEGIDVGQDDEDEDEASEPSDDAGTAQFNDWCSGHTFMSYRPRDECLPRNLKPLSKQNQVPKRRRPKDEVDPRAAADFYFVEKIAKERGLAQESKRLHYFYRLPTDEKIKWIQDIVHFISCH